MKIAVSFAGENRDLVDDIVRGIKSNLCNLTSPLCLGNIIYQSTPEEHILFYDNDYTAELCGEDLITCFQKIYGTYELVFGFVDRHYLNKKWTNLEQSIIKERLLDNRYRESFFIPIMLDDSLLDFYPNYMGYIDGKDRNAERILSIICKKIEGKSIEDDLQYTSPEDHSGAFKLLCKDFEVCFSRYMNDLGGVAVFNIPSKKEAKWSIIIHRNCYGMEMFSIHVKAHSTIETLVKDSALLADLMCYRKLNNWIIIDNIQNRLKAGLHLLENFPTFHKMTEALFHKICAYMR